MRPDELGLEDLDTIWKSGSNQRADMRRRRQYYDGRHDILDRAETYKDGTQKTNRVTNWCKYAVNRYVGALSDVQVTKETDAEPGEEAETDQGVDAYQELAERENLVIKDTTLLKYALIYGSAVEVHSLKEGVGVRIGVYDPSEWCVLWEDEETIFLAMHQTTFDEGDIYAGEYVSEETTVRTVYTASRIKTYIKRKPKGGERSEFVLDADQQHAYGRAPLVVWRIDDEGEGLLTEALRDQNDEYNESDSSNGDSLKRETENLLVLKGLDPNWLMQNEQVIRNLGMLPLPGDDEGADASYLTRTFDNERVENRLRRTRKHIHVMAEVPDVAEIVGTSGATSGIALKLMFTPMQERAETMIANLARCVRQRIDLVNAVAGKLSRPVLEDYGVVILFRMPINRIEEWTSIGSLTDIVSHKTQLELLTDIDDPTQELAEVLRETAEIGSRRADAQANRNLDAEPQPGQEEAFVERREREVNALGDVVIGGLEPIIRELSENITTAVRSGFTRVPSN